eukprot:6173457-Pleurochrysis_carterae.AAC.1
MLIASIVREIAIEIGGAAAEARAEEGPHRMSTLPVSGSSLSTVCAPARRANPERTAFNWHSNIGH